MKRYPRLWLARALLLGALAFVVAASLPAHREQRRHEAVKEEARALLARDKDAKSGVAAMDVLSKELAVYPRDVLLYDLLLRAALRAKDLGLFAPKDKTLLELLHSGASLDPHSFMIACAVAFKYQTALVVRAQADEAAALKSGDGQAYIAAESAEFARWQDLLKLRSDIQSLGAVDETHAESLRPILHNWFAHDTSSGYSFYQLAKNGLATHALIESSEACRAAAADFVEAGAATEIHTYTLRLKEVVGECPRLAAADVLLADALLHMGEAGGALQASVAAEEAGFDDDAGGAFIQANVLAGDAYSLHAISCLKLRGATVHSLMAPPVSRATIAKYCSDLAPTISAARQADPQNKYLVLLDQELKSNRY